MTTRRYVYRRRTARFLARLFDAAGAALVRIGRRRARPEFDARRLGRVLCIRLDHLGDVLFATPALAALRAALPETRLVLLAGPWAARVVEGSDLVDSVHVLDVPWFARPRRPGGLRTWLGLVRWLRSQRFDAAIDFRGDLRHLLALAVARVPIRLGWGATGGGFLLTWELPEVDAHEVERNLALAGALVPGLASGPLAPMRFSAEEVERVVALRQATGCDAGHFVVAHPAAGYASKCWETGKWVALLDLLQAANDIQVALVGSAGERADMETLARRTRRPPAVLAGRTDLGELAALLAGAAAFVGHDSGPAHVAVAAGVPCVLLYSGVNDIGRWGPWGGRVRLFHAPVECSPCGLPVCDRAHECMQPFSPEAVHAAVVAALRGEVRA